jgi:hypothetical protein
MTTKTTKAAYSVKTEDMTAVVTRAIKNAIRRGRPFTADDIKLPEGFDRRSLGGLILRASRNGLIVATGTVHSTRPAARSRKVCQWMPISANTNTKKVAQKAR